LVGWPVDPLVDRPVGPSVDRSAALSVGMAADFPLDSLLAHRNAEKRTG